MSGLLNIGATCWFNSFLQVLASCPDILKLPGNSSALSWEFQKFRNSSGGVYNPEKLHALFEEYLQNKSADLHKNFRLFGQQDSQEYMNLFIEALGSEKCFNHRYAVDTICHKCKSHISTRDINCFYKLYLTDPDLEDSIIQKAETIPDYICERCKTTGVVVLRTLEYTPELFTFLLTKYQKKYMIELPASFLVNPFTYSLMATIEHSGSMSGGHYWAVCKRKGKTFIFNDSSVSSGELQITPNTYLAIYIRNDVAVGS